MSFSPMSQVPPVAPMQSGKALFTRNMVSTMVLLGIIVFFIGTMVSSSTVFVKSPSYSDYSDYTLYEQAQKDYTYRTHDMLGAGDILIEIGGLLACMGFLGGAIENNTVPVAVKVGFISAAISFIVTTIIVLILIARIGSIY